MRKHRTSMRPSSPHSLLVPRRRSLPAARGPSGAPPRLSRRPLSVRPSAPRGSFAEPSREALPTSATRASTPESRAQAVEWLRGWSRGQCGISFSEEQSGLLGVRMESLCRDLELPLEQVQMRVERGDHALTLRLAEAVSTNYTFFFREPEMFNFLRDRGFARLQHGAPLRVWSAASSSGDEAYSIAIQARENLGDGASRVRILGTDISERQLKLAEQGSYRREQLGPLSPARLARWFTPLPDGQLRVRDELRQMCTFRRLNLLARPWPFEQKFHVIFLRNVLYYFEPQTRSELLEACYDAVEPNGYLITSLTEPMGDLSTRWTTVAPSIFFRGAR